MAPAQRSLGPQTHRPGTRLLEVWTISRRNSTPSNWLACLHFTCDTRHVGTAELRAFWNHLPSITSLTLDSRKIRFTAANIKETYTIRPTRNIARELLSDRKILHRRPRNITMPITFGHQTKLQAHMKSTIAISGRGAKVPRHTGDARLAPIVNKTLHATTANTITISSWVSPMIVTKADAPPHIHKLSFLLMNGFESKRAIA